MPFIARDVIVYLTDFPYKFLVPAHTGVITRTPVTDYSKANNYRNVATGGLPPGAVAFGAVNGTATFVPATTMPSTQDLSDALVAILDDPTQEMAGLPNAGPRPESYTRVRLNFSVADQVSDGTSPYSCWEDEFRACGGIDPTNELDE